MSGREDISNRYLSSGFGGGVEAGLSRMLGEERDDKPQFCAHCGELSKPVYKNPNDRSGSSVYCKKHYEELFASKCEGCHKGIVGEYLNSHNKKYHPQCVPESGKCFQCKKPIIGEAISAVDQTYHPACFKCSQCNTALVNATFHTLPSGNSHDLYCLKCVDALKVSRSSIKGVEQKNQQDAAKLAQQKQQQEEENRLAKQLQNNLQLGKEGCAWCRTPFDAKATALASGGKIYHPECFKDAGLGPSSSDNCAGCGKEVVGKFLKDPSGTKYHPQCFKCSVCVQPITGGFANRNGSVVCAKCATATSSGSTTKTTTTTTVTGNRVGGFTVDPRSGKKTTYN